MVKGKSVLDDSFEEFEKTITSLLSQEKKKMPRKLLLKKIRLMPSRIMQIQTKHTKRLCTLEYLN